MPPPMGGEEPDVDVDITVPSVARMYDYALGGKDNYVVDREAVDRLEQLLPGTAALCRTSRAFLSRAVRVLAEEYGVRQFLDHGSGLPTQSNVHQVAQRVDPQARVVYVDNDPVVVAHGRALLAENDHTVVVRADIRDVTGVHEHPEVRGLIDFTQPVAALFVSVTHCLGDDDDPAGLLRRVIARLCPGSFLVLNQLVAEDPRIRRTVTDFMVEATRGNWGRVRRRHEVEQYFHGLQVLPPGLGDVSRWRPDVSVVGGGRAGARAWGEFGGVARVP